MATFPKNSSLILYLASTNLGKIGEFRDAARACSISVEALPGLPNLPRCLEDGRTFEENACKKAIHYSKLAAGLIFADDSGISVDALGGAPGIYSARFAGPGASDEANNQKLLEELRHRTVDLEVQVRGASRTVDRCAHYVCVIALAERGRILTAVEGLAHGLILEQPRGKGGFGYDPVFLYPPLSKTFAELTPEEKFAASHRGKAFRKLLDYVRNTLSWSGS